MLNLPNKYLLITQRSRIESEFPTKYWVLAQWILQYLNQQIIIKYIDHSRIIIKIFLEWYNMYIENLKSIFDHINHIYRVVILEVKKEFYPFIVIITWYTCHWLEYLPKDYIPPLSKNNHVTSWCDVYSLISY